MKSVLIFLCLLFLAPFVHGKVKADFTSSDTVITLGEVVQFTNLSSGDPTFQMWTFPGATPQITYKKNPIIMYHTPGIYDVSLYVEGINGEDSITKQAYIEVLPPNNTLPPGWEYTTTFTQHVHILPLSSNPRIFETAISPGDYIGVFYTDDYGHLKCGGAVTWNDTANTSFPAQGDNFMTSEKDGFDTGETFTWKIYATEMQEEFPATPTYGSQFPFSFFIPNGISGLDDVHAGTLREIIIPPGWSGIASSIQPWYSDLEDLFGGESSEINILVGESGIFMPTQNINTLGAWDNSGYLINADDSFTAVFKGYPASPALTINEGWNILPVPVDCPIAIQTLFAGNLDKLLQIKEIGGTALYWPEYGITKLDTLMPCKAYLVLVTQGFALEFPVCP